MQPNNMNPLENAMLEREVVINGRSQCNFFKRWKWRISKKPSIPVTTYCSNDLGGTTVDPIGIESTNVVSNHGHYLNISIVKLLQGIV